MREEGEISENEDPPFRQPERLIPAPPPTTALEALYATKLASSKVRWVMCSHLLGLESRRHPCAAT
jgi:hypothetical protein